MGVAYEAATIGASGAATTHTIAHTINAANGRTVVFPFIGVRSLSPTTGAVSCTYGGQAVTAIAEVSQQTCIWAGYKTAPLSGAQNAVFQIAESKAAIVGVLELYNAHQASPISDQAQATVGSTDTKLTATVSGDADMLGACFGSLNHSLGVTASHHGVTDMTQRAKLHTDFQGSGCGTTAGAGSMTGGYTPYGITCSGLAILSIAVEFGPAGGSQVIFFFERMQEMLKSLYRGWKPSEAQWRRKWGDVCRPRRVEKWTAVL